MIPLLIEILLLGTLSGITAAVLYAVLRNEAPRWVANFFIRNEGKKWTKPLWYCVICMSGQVGLWAYLCIEVLPALIIDPAAGNSYPALMYVGNPLMWFIGAVMTVCLSIFTAMLATRLIHVLQHTSHKYQ